MRFYVSQYGYVWSLTYDQYVQVLTQGAQGSYDLTPYRELKSFWSSLSKTDDERRIPKRFYDAWLEGNFNIILDWDTEDFKAELERLRQL